MSTSLLTGVDSDFSPSAPQSGTLLRWYRPDKGVTTSSGKVTQWNDQTANAANATQASSAAQFTFTTNYLTGAGAQYMTASGTGLPAGTSTGAFTMCAWFRTSVTQGTNAICGWGAEGGNSMNLLFLSNSNFGYSNFGQALTTSTTDNDGNWHFGVFSWGGTNTTQKLYKDGVKVTSFSINNLPTTLNVTASTPFGIGQLGNTQPAGWFFTGDLSDIYIYSGQVTDSDVANLYIYGRH